jgi:cob(I)alamin adenosyltransferase
MKIYTRTGDQGKTRLLGGGLVDKSDERIEAYGSVDELNSCLGVVLANQNLPSHLSAQLLRIQSELFNLGSRLACDDANIMQKLPAINPEHIAKLELEIDQMTKDLPELKNFILPGGSAESAHLHVARTVCRRAERLTVKVFLASTPEAQALEACVIYLNRLSDYLFTAARWVNHKSGSAEILWKPS